jgi:hypothetical protein
MSEHDNRDDGLVEGLSPYNVPSEIPRDAIWAAISLERRAPYRARRVHYGYLIAAAVVVFAAGLATGHSLGKPRVETQKAALTAQLRAHLSASDSLITLIRLDAGVAKQRPEIEHRARRLLATTRTLQESTAVGPGLQGVLRDLDLVLEQIAQYSAGAAVSPREGEYIQAAIAERGLATALTERLREGMEDP